MKSVRYAVVDKHSCAACAMEKSDSRLCRLTPKRARDFCHLIPASFAIGTPAFSQIVGEHAQQHMGPHALCAARMDGPDLEIDGFRSL
jgi:hypothetical protein